MFWKKPKARPVCRCYCGGIERLVQDRRSPLRYSVDQARYYLQTSNRQFMVNHCPMCGSPVRYAWTPVELSDEQRAILAQLREEVTSVDDIEPKFGPPDAMGEFPDERPRSRSAPAATVVCRKTWIYYHAVPFATIYIGELNDGSLTWIYASI